jgi:hypothetical protein
MKTWNEDCDNAVRALNILGIKPDRSQEIIKSLCHDGQDAAQITLVVLDVCKSAAEIDLLKEQKKMNHRVLSFWH